MLAPVQVSAGPGATSVTFIVRISIEAGRVSGIVERVRTGEKERFRGVDDLGRIITRMITGNAEGTPENRTRPEG